MQDFLHHDGWHDMHAHLHAYLSAEDVFELGKDLWQKRLPRLEWYATEFEKACGRRPDFRSYWQNEGSGFLELQKDFTYLSGVSSSTNGFQEFQAKFNLLIALFPITPSDRTIVDYVLESIYKRAAASKKWRSVELRAFIPPTMQISELDTYLQTLAAAFSEVAAKYSSKHFRATCALSLARQPQLAMEQYRILRAWSKNNESLASWFSGIDFCGDECGPAPRFFGDLFAAVREDNSHANQEIQTLFHVGEMWHHLSPPSAARWVMTAAEQGAHRLGHALALGIDWNAFKEKKFFENASERKDHILWILNRADTLATFGYKPEVKSLSAELDLIASNPNSTHTWLATHENLIDLHLLQEALLKYLHQKMTLSESSSNSAIMIECCPTSNNIIARLNQRQITHPLQRFMSADLHVVLGTDDPGLLNTSIEREYEQAYKLIKKL